jgi:hypothetical protein
MELTIEIPEKLIKRAEELGLPVRTLVDQALIRLSTLPWRVKPEASSISSPCRKTMTLTSILLNSKARSIVRQTSADVLARHQCSL